MMPSAIHLLAKLAVLMTWPLGENREIQQAAPVLAGQFIVAEHHYSLVEAFVQSLTL